MAVIGYRSKGFAIGSILLVIVLIGSVVAAISLSGKSSSNVNLTGQKAEILASSIIYQGTQLSNAFEIMKSNGLLASEITWDKSPQTGMFHPIDGSIPRQYVPNEADYFGSSLQRWGYKRSAKLNAVGTSSGNDFVALVTLKPEVCKKINNILHGSSISDDLPEMTSAGTTHSKWKRYAHEVFDNAPYVEEQVDATGDNAVIGRREGCFAVSRGVWYPLVNYYFKVMHEQ